MKTLNVYGMVRRNIVDSRVVVTRIEVAKRGKGSYSRKSKYGKKYE